MDLFHLLTKEQEHKQITFLKETFQALRVR